jgi:Site-specific recombinase XerC
MAELHSPRSRKRSDGQEVFVADYIDDTGGRHQIDCGNEREARLMTERRDARFRADISFAGYLLRFSDSLTESRLTGVTARQYQGRLRRCAGLAPEIALADADATTVAELSRSLGRQGLHHDTIASYLQAVGLAFAQALDEGRIACNPVKTYFSEPGRGRNVMDHRLDLPDSTLLDAILPRLSPWLRPGLLLSSKAGLPARQAVCVQSTDITIGKGRVAVRRTLVGNKITSPLSPACLRNVLGVDPEALRQILDAPRVSRGGPWVMQRNGPQRPVGRVTLYQDLLKQLRQVQQDCGIASLETEKPYTIEDFRDRWVVDRLRVDEPLVVMAMAGYSSFSHFAARYGTEFVRSDSHEQMELGMIGMEALAALENMSA